MVNHRVRWRYVLPISQVLLAGTLIYTARLEKQVFVAEGQVREAARARAQMPGEETPGWQPISAWDYVPRSTQVLVAVDLPAFVPFAPLALFDVQPTPHAFFYPAVGLACVFLFWWCVGRWLDFRPAPVFKNRAIRIAIVSAGLLASMGFGVAVWRSYWSEDPVAPLARLGAAAWCLVGIVVCATTLKRSLLPRR
jgi:hypothetical protein